MRAIRITVREISPAPAADARPLRRNRPRVRVTLTLCRACREYVAVAGGECAECALMGGAHEQALPGSLAWEPADALEAGL